MKPLATTYTAGLVLVLVMALLALTPSSRAADDRILFHDPSTKKDEDISGVITEESPAGIKVRTKRETKLVPAAQVVQVIYNDSRVGPLELRAPDGFLSRAVQAPLKSKARDELLDKAQERFQSLDDKLKDSDRIHAYLRFRLAQIAVYRAQSDPTRADAAITALKAYKTDFPAAWETVAALKMLAQMQEAKGDSEGASEAYAALADLPGAPEDLKRQGQMLVVKTLLRGRKFDEAERRLQEMERAGSQNDPSHVFVKVYLAQARIAQNNLAGTREQLVSALQSSSSPDLRALAHNALGDLDRQEKKLDAAFWEYLKVDTLYNQDREEAARALYNLAELHDKVNNDPIRAEECRTRLASPDFAGTYYQRLGAEKAPRSGS